MSKQRQRGVSLIEVLVAVLVIAVGLLGLAGLQLKAMQNSQSSYLSSQAVIMASSIIDQARAQGGHLSDSDKTRWGNQLANFLPDGSGTATINTASKQITVTISWIDAHWAEAPDEGGDEEAPVPDERRGQFSMTSTL